MSATGMQATSEHDPAFMYKQISVAVAMAPHGSPDQHVGGVLCVPPGPRAAVVQVLIPGGTYGLSYWSMRGAPDGPSYVEAMSAAGYATLAIDRLGAGRSSRPPSSRFEDQTHEFVVHQLIQQLRAGAIGGRAFERVILVGNSFGSTLARMVAVHYPGDADGLILTGETSTPNWAAFAAHEADYLPASQDPRFADQGLDDGYLVVQQGAKSRMFYHQPAADPSVMASDEAAPEPDVYPADPEYGSPALDREITLPVLIVVGQYDQLMCGEGATDCSSSAALLASEQKAYGPGAAVEAAVIADAGHALNLHTTAPVWFDIASDWMGRHFGARRAAG